MNESKAKSIIARLVGAYPGEIIDNDKTQLWMNVLATVESSQAEIAVSDWIRTETQWPTPAQFNSLITKMTSTRQQEWEPPKSNVRCDGNRWIDAGSGPYPCPACNPWLHELWQNGELFKRHPDAPPGYTVPAACYSLTGPESKPVADRDTAIRLLLAGYREGKAEMGMDESAIEARIAERYDVITAWAKIVPEPSGQ